MNNNKADFFQNTPGNYLQVINGIKFTSREIDIIACLLGGRTTKTISQFLEIEEKTVETHKYNVMRKLECNSKESIINFIEKSDKFSAIKKHYLNLLSKVLFEKKLREFQKLGNNKDKIYALVYCKSKPQQAFLAKKLQEDFKLSGLTLTLEARESYASSHQLVHHLEISAPTCIFYMISEELPENFSDQVKEGSSELFPFLQKASQNLSQIVFLLREENISKNSLSKIQGYNYVHFEEHYPLAFFQILKKVFLDKNAQNIIADFVKHFHGIHAGSDKSFSQSWVSVTDDVKTKKTENLFFFRLSRKIKIGFSLLLFSTSCIAFLNFQNYKVFNKSSEPILRKSSIIRSSLSIPADQTLLNRPQFLTKIDNALKGDEGIQTVALIGIGGAGKTTLARQYARGQKSSIVWEINAETNGSLMSSFEELAYALCQSEEEKKVLREIQEIKKSEERKDKLILFVKEKMCLRSNWLLVFDNVEKFETIQKHYPSDPQAWGMGKIIITTRDANIQNNHHVNYIVSIGELNSQEKLDLFMNVMRQQHVSQSRNAQQERVQKFLHFIPPFPLDISIAAYYIKTTDVSYERYLEYLKESNQSFENVQEKILKESDEYTKTRYSIIKLSLQKLIETDENFKGLLFFISLLDSQNIPKDLLSSLKDNVITDSFIYHLKKYSLITNESQIRSISSISFHRSTQTISLNYLKSFFDLKQKDYLFRQLGLGLETYMAKAIDEDDLLPIKGHCEALLKHKDISANLAKSSARCTLGAIYFYLGNYQKAKEFLEGNLIDLNKNDKTNYPVLGRTYGYLGTVYRALGNYEKAERYLEQGLLTYQENLPEDYTRRSWILAQKGIVYRELGNYQKAKELIEQSYILIKENFSADHLRTAWILATLGTVAIELEDYKEASELLKNSLSVYRKYYSDNHIRIAWILANLGKVYRELGNYEEAKSSLEQSLIIFQKHYFDSHVQFVRALRNLGSVVLPPV